MTARCTSRRSSPLITDRESTARHALDQIRDQITALTDQATRLERDLTDLATTRSTLRALAATEFTAEEPTVPSSAYQQILTVLAAASTGLRARDICLALDIEPLPKNIEGTRQKLKRLVSRHLLTETEPGIFTLAQKQT